MSAAESAQTPPQALLMQMSLGYMVPFLLRTAAQLRLADHLAGGARTAEQLAAATGTHAPQILERGRIVGCRWRRGIETNGRPLLGHQARRDSTSPRPFARS